MDIYSKRKDRQLSIMALFLYATIIVDLYRKINNNIVKLPISVTMFRNAVYILIFAALLILIREKRIYDNLIIVSAIFLFITIFSYLINPYENTLSLFIDVIMMFASRLLPAYYIGRFLAEGDEKIIIKKTRGLQWIALIYEIFIIIYPEVSQTSYMTISTNIILVTLLCLFSNNKGKYAIITYAISIFGLFIITVYGGRGSLVAVLFVFAIRMFITQRSNRTIRKIIGIMTVIILAVLFIIFYQQIAEGLLALYPGSRTLKLMAKGQLFWESNRNNYYDAALQSLWNNPLKMYGFLGDRFYFAKAFGSIWDYSKIVTMFTHNVLLELMLNFGLLIGLLIIIVYTAKIIKAFIYIEKSKDINFLVLYVVIFGSTFVNMMISSSYLNDYSIWLLIGLSINYAGRLRKRRKYQNGKNEDSIEIA